MRLYLTHLFSNYVRTTPWSLIARNKLNWFVSCDHPHSVLHGNRSLYNVNAKELHTYMQGFIAIGGLGNIVLFGKQM